VAGCGAYLGRALPRSAGPERARQGFGVLRVLVIFAASGCLISIARISISIHTNNALHPGEFRGF
jgi:hypothetical protein